MGCIIDMYPSLSNDPSVRFERDGRVVLLVDDPQKETVLHYLVLLSCLPRTARDSPRGWFLL